MKKYEYRCEKCMTIEERYTFGSDKPLNFIFCFKCGSEALRYPQPKLRENAYKKYR